MRFTTIDPDLEGNCFFFSYLYLSRLAANDCVTGDFFFRDWIVFALGLSGGVEISPLQ